MQHAWSIIIDDLWLCLSRRLALITFLNSIVSLSGGIQYLKNLVIKPEKLKKFLPCPSPILFSRSDTSISTSMVSKSFEMHSLIINPVNEFFINPNEFLYLLPCRYSVTFRSLLSNFLVNFDNFSWVLSWPWPRTLSDSVQVRFQLSTNRFWCITTLDLSFSFSVFNF